MRLSLASVAAMPLIEQAHPASSPSPPSLIPLSELAAPPLLLLSPPRKTRRSDPGPSTKLDLFSCSHSGCHASFQEFLGLRAHEVAVHKLQCSSPCTRCGSRQVRHRSRCTLIPLSSFTGPSTSARTRTAPLSALIEASSRRISATPTTASRVALPAHFSRATALSSHHPGRLRGRT